MNHCEGEFLAVPQFCALIHKSVKQFSHCFTFNGPSMCGMAYPMGFVLPL